MGRYPHGKNVLRQSGLEIHKRTRRTGDCLFKRLPVAHERSRDMEYMDGSFLPASTDKENKNQRRRTDTGIIGKDRYVDSCEEPVLYKEYVPNEWDISEEELNPDTQYCFVIRSGRA